MLSIPIVAMDVNLLEEEMGWKRVAGGNVRPVKATVLQVMTMYMLAGLYYPSNQLWATVVWEPMVGRPG